MTARHWTTALAGLLTMMLAAFAASAADPFTVRDIHVDLTRETAGQAREEAMENAHREAFAHLLRRLTTSDRHGMLPEPSYQEILETVAGLQVVRERMSAMRYIGELAISFKPDDVRAILSRAGVPFSDTQASPVVVVPLYGDGASAVLWQGDNPWREAWRFHGPAAGLVPTVLPPGDEGDVATLDAGQAAAFDRDALQALAARHDTEGGIVARATWAMAPDRGAGTVTVEVTGFGSQPLPDTWRQRVTGEPGEGAEQVAFRAVQQVVAALEGAWKQDTVMAPGEGFDAIEATAGLTGVQDLVEIRRRLERVPLLRRTDLVSLTRSEALFRLQYTGEFERLRQALERHGVTLLPGMDGSARLVLAESGMAPRL